MFVGMNMRFTAVYLLLLFTGLYLNLHSDIDVPMKRSFEQFPRIVSEWHMAGETSLSGEVQKVLKATDMLSRQYATYEGKRVNLYIGYHSGGQGGGEIHSPKHCLPGSGWYEVSTDRTQLDVAGKKVNLVQAIYRKGDSKELFMYWFQVRDRTISEEYSLKVAEIWSSIRYRRRDASFIRVSVPFEIDEQAAVITGERFIRDFLPAIQTFLPS